MGEMRSDALQRISRHLLVGALSTAAAIASANAAAAIDIFAKIGDIKGESTDSKHADEINVLAWSWGKSEASLPPPAQGRAIGKGCLSSFNIVKRVDKATPALLLAAADGTSMPTATLAARKAGGGQLDYFVVKFIDIRITSVVGGGKSQDDNFTEKLEFSFSSATVTYTPTSDGVVSGPAVSTTFTARSCD